MIMRDRNSAPTGDRAPLLPYLVRLTRNVRSKAQAYIDQRRKRLMLSLADGTVLEVASIVSDVAAKGDMLAHAGSRFTRVSTGDDNQVLASRAAARGGVEWGDISDLMPFGGHSQEMLVRKNATVTDILPLLQSVTMDRVVLWSDTVFVTAGTYTLDIQKNGVSILSMVFDLTSLSALTPTALMFSSSTSFVSGDYITLIATSSHADLTGSGLRVIFNF